MEIIFELIFQIIGEIVFEGVFEGLGWLLRRRWGRLIFGVLTGLGGGLVWSLGVGHDGAPLVATGLVAIQTATAPRLAGRRLFGIALRRDVATDLAVIGAAVVAGRWIGWAAG